MIKRNNQFRDAAWADVLCVMTEFHTEVAHQLMRYGKIVAAPSLKKIIGSFDDSRHARHRLTLRLYGYWLVDPELARRKFNEWIDEAYDDGRSDTLYRKAAVPPNNKRE